MFEDRDDRSHDCESSAHSWFRDPDIQTRFVPWRVDDLFGNDTAPEDIPGCNDQRVAQGFSWFLYQKCACREQLVDAFDLDLVFLFDRELGVGWRTRLCGRNGRPLVAYDTRNLEQLR